MMMCTNDLRYYICKLFWWGQRKQSGQAVFEEAVIIKSPLGHSVTLWMWRIRLHYHLHLKKLRRKSFLWFSPHMRKEKREIYSIRIKFLVSAKRGHQRVVKFKPKTLKKKWELFCATWVHWMKKYWVGNNTDTLI